MTWADSFLRTLKENDVRLVTYVPDLYAAGHRPQNFYMLGSMGLACPIALGVALAQPERGVIALEGDGSILMALGCLTTIGMVKPRNLTIVIMDNGIYQVTGKQAAATASSADIVAIARGAGIANSQWVRDERHFEQLVSRRFDDGGPSCWRRRSTTSPGSGRRCATRRSSAIASCAGSAPAGAVRWTPERSQRNACTLEARLRLSCANAPGPSHALGGAA